MQRLLRAFEYNRSFCQQLRHSISDVRFFVEVRFHLRNFLLKLLLPLILSDHEGLKIVDDRLGVGDNAKNGLPNF